MQAKTWAKNTDTPVAVLPLLVVAVDPDSRSTALAWAVRRGDRYVFTGMDGGGSRRVSWQSIKGQRAWLRETSARLGAERLGLIEPSDVTVVVETQAPDGPQSKDCEPLRRVRYHLEATCEIDGYDYTESDAGTWQRVFLQGEPCGRGAGARKVAYQRRAKALTDLAVNEDRCAALGILWWYVVDVLGSTLDCGG